MSGTNWGIPELNTTRFTGDKMACSFPAIKRMSFRIAASYWAINFCTEIKKVSRTFNNKISRAGHPAMGNLSEILAILFNPGRHIILMH